MLTRDPWTATSCSAGILGRMTALQPTSEVMAFLIGRPGMIFTRPHLDLADGGDYTTGGGQAHPSSAQGQRAASDGYCCWRPGASSSTEPRRWRQAA